MSILTKVKKKLKSGTWYPFYNTFYEKEKPDTQMIFLESRSGRGIESNIFSIIRELNKPQYSRFKIVLAYKDGYEERIKEKLKHYGLKADRLVRYGSISYYHTLSKAGYLINDTSFPGRFIKKEGQVYLNVWHGTPLKCMGRDIQNERYSIGNVMRNLLMADYLLFPNTYMEEKMSGAYMLRNLYNGKVIHECYPRNEIFFYPEKGRQLKSELGLEGMQVSVYMPTFRGKADAADQVKSADEVAGYLKKMDMLLDDDQVLLVKFHPFVEDTLNLQEFRHIKRFPDIYDTYDVLNMCDILITDYSSVMYDFANTGRKIILFAYDLDQYADNRGMYEDIRTYPFPIARTPEETVELMHQPWQGLDEEFRDRYCTYENGNGVSRLCRHLILKEDVCKTEQMKSNGKENVLIYAGDFQKNGITAVFLNLMKELDRNQYNYYISFRMNSLKDTPWRLDCLWDDADIYPIASEMNLDLFTAIQQACFLKFGIKGPGNGKRLKHAYEREWRKHFGDSRFKAVIHYNGYENYMLSLIRYAPFPRTIWVHSNMEQEIRRKKNPSRYALHDAYYFCDHVAAVSQDAADSVISISGRGDNVTVIPNCQDYKAIGQKAQLPVAFGCETSSTIDLPQLEKILESPDRKFISIGRYSVEKQHSLLIEAFERYWMEHRNTWLIIIGGTGNLYEQTCSLAQKSEAGSHIVLIRGMDNPMPILKKCDLFVLSSEYEGCLPVVLYEADILGIPFVATDIPGTHCFMEKHGGCFVSPSVEGLYGGMKAFEEGKVEALHMDCAENNRKSAQMFLKLIQGGN